ncbi:MULTISPECIES: hypothetical protein [Actinoplanes]|uniref:Uncharacterized protein n=2 Tax=Actinoplanes TaxID=1865 RepID=A0A101JNF3_9ACTN|nr:MULTISPECIES: hypothetical protein [Actinoplanes]KUL30002.1 hypothetical protein ADL15_25865 [Actinoplanes awajinensis subsp. mycoplanecinus]GIE71617.1 hypothetical protein Apa02nite_077250 [Actinoplanes palleronii]
MRVYLAEGVQETVVGLRAPASSVPCDQLELGSIVVLRPRPGLHGQLRVSFEVPRAAGWRLFGRSPSDYRFVVQQDDRADLRRAVDAAVLTMDRWPVLRDHVGLSDPSPKLAQAVWELAGLLTDRDRVRLTWEQLTEADPDVPRGSPLRAELAARATHARARLRELDVAAGSRVGHLTRLADQTEAFVRQQQALANARALLRESDYLIGAPSPAPGHETLDLAEHTSAVLTAYRELTV